mmetsp:Transcript_20569/g.51789  ORF Transcript_20569/g.51789 Transcript_20569/m.51789 type:complete len:392 (-) Transcript_20569:909-2084(-)
MRGRAGQHPHRGGGAAERDGEAGGGRDEERDPEGQRRGDELVPVARPAEALREGERHGERGGGGADAGGALRQGAQAAGEQLGDALPREGRRRGALLRADAVGGLEELVGEHPDHGPEGDPHQLRLELLPRGGAHEVAGLEVRRHVAGLRGARGRHGRLHDVGPRVPGREHRKQELRDLAAPADGVDVDLAHAPHGDVRQRGGERQRDAGLPHRHPERQAHGEHGARAGQQEAPLHHGLRDLVRVVLLRGGGALGRRQAGGHQLRQRKDQLRQRAHCEQRDAGPEDEAARARHRHCRSGYQPRGLHVRGKEPPRPHRPQANRKRGVRADEHADAEEHGVELHRKPKLREPLPERELDRARYLRNEVLCDGERGGGKEPAQEHERLGGRLLA